MNNEKCFYHEDIGVWVTITDPNEKIRSTYPEGTIEIPLPPSNMHKFVDGEWVEPTQDELDQAQAFKVRLERNNKLETEVDPIVMNSLRWASMTKEQRKKISDYRKSLLDIPQQAGFPHHVVWPSL